jgi:hypothetical protein
MSKGTFKVIPIEIYCTELVVSIGQTDDEIFDECKKRWEWDKYESVVISSVSSQSLANFSSNSKMFMIRFKEKEPKDGLIAHEAFHAAFRILNSIGLNPSYETEEAYAYLLDYIVNKIKEKTNK